MDNQYLKVQDVAKILLLSTYSIRRYIKQGKLKATKLGRSYLISPLALEALLKVS